MMAVAANVLKVEEMMKKASKSKDPSPYYETLSAQIVAKDAAYRKIIGDNLKAIREHFGWSQLKVSELSGIHRTRISELENGRWSSTVLTLIQISSAYGVPVESLLMPGTAAKYPPKS